MGTVGIGMVAREGDLAAEVAIGIRKVTDTLNRRLIRIKMRITAIRKKLTKMTVS